MAKATAKKTPKTFWNGRRADDVATVNAQIPKTGETPDVILENFRRFQNMYYRYFNDGDKPNYQAMRRLAKMAKIEWTTSNRETLMEQIGDALLDQALKQINDDDFNAEPNEPLYQEAG